MNAGTLTRGVLAVGLILPAGGLCVLSAFDRAGYGLSDAFGAARPRAVAARAIQRGDAAAAVRAAEVVVRRDPLGRPSMSLLGTALLLAGNPPAGNRALGVATAMGWRDEAAQIWAVEASLAGNDVVNAAAHLDALRRATPTLQTPAFWWAALEASPAGRDALSRRLALNPPWAANWVASSAQVPEAGVGPRLATVALARARGLAVDDATATGATWEMIKHHPREAVVLWELLHGHGDRARTGLWDASFTRFDPASPVSGPFGWYRPEGAGAQVSRGVEGGRPVLRISELGSADTPLLRAATALPPGGWRLSWREGGGALAFRPALTCLVQGDVVPLDTGSVGGRRYQDFRVAPDCPVQSLSLSAGGPDATASEGWIADLRFDRRGG